MSSPRKMMMSKHSRKERLPSGKHNMKPMFLALPEFKDDSCYARFKQKAKLAFRTINLKHTINLSYVVTNEELHTAQAEWCFHMAQIHWTNDVAHTILNWYEYSNNFCGAWLEITGYFDKAMTTKLKRIRLQGFFTTVRFHNVMHEWKGGWLYHPCHLANLPVSKPMQI
jgi:hypothetical protein